MKTKNILPAIALLMGTLLCTPAFAQELDYHEQEALKQEVTNNIKNSMPKQQKEYLKAGQLFNQMNEDLPIDYDKLLETATNSINNNEISDKNQYDLMAFAIQTKHNDVLATLILAGFDPEIDVKLNQNLSQGKEKFFSLAARAVIGNNQEAFKHVFLPRKERNHYIINELEYDISLVARFSDFVTAYNESRPLPQLFR